MIVRGDGPYVFDAQGKRYLDGLSGLFVVQVGHGRVELAEAAYKQASELAFFPLWSYAHPQAAALAERLAERRSRRPEPGLLHHRRRRGGRDGLEAGAAVLQGRRQAAEIQGDQPQRSPTTAPRWARCRSPASRPPSRSSSRSCPSAIKVANTNFYRAPEHGDDLEAFGRWAADQIEQAILMEGPDTVACVFLEPVQNSGGCFPPPPGYFAAGPRDLRQVRRAAGVRRGHLRLRAARGDVRLRPLRLPARHDHLRQGHDQRLLTDRRDDRQRAPRRAVPEGRRQLRARLHLRRPPGLGRGRHGQPRHLRARAAASTTSRPTRTAFAPRWRSSTTCRSSATCAATATSTASNSSRTRPPRRPSTTTSPSGCCAASCPRRCSTPGSTAGPMTAAIRSCSWRRRSSASRPTSMRSSRSCVACSPRPGSRV